MAKKMGNTAKNAAVGRYGWLVIFFICIFIAIVIGILKIKYVEGSMWRQLGKEETIKKDREIFPTRGNIYSDDGRLLATSEPLYGVYIDFMADGIQQDSLMKYVVPLSLSLAKAYPDKTSNQYKKLLIGGWQLSRKELALIKKKKETKSTKKISIKSRHVRLIERDINYVELKELKTFAFLNQRSNKSGLLTDEKTRRLKPFGRLAGRTVGSINKDLTLGGTSGLELKYDSILHGIPGVKSRQRIQGSWRDVTLVEPTAGQDIQTTLNIEMQDIAEKALARKLIETKAESGCAIVMEVATGQIKAVSNLDRISEGIYGEGNPNAFSYMFEPGSTFKTVSLMVALEDGVVSPRDSFYVGNGQFAYRGRIVKDWDWRKGLEKDYVTVEKGMWNSSNVVVSKMILKGYENDPKKYVEGIYKLGLNKKLTWDVPLKGREGTVSIRMPDDKANPWSKVTLPWMSFGYETQIPPIYMLMFYNGIANNGLMIKPFLTRAFTKDGSIETEFEAEVINKSLASDKTLKEVQEILKGVITQGTGKSVQSKLFTIAGKTGTSMLASNGQYSGYYVSFCGYFPADNPQYTCFVSIRKPEGNPSGGLMPGAVFKEIAEGIYTRNRVNVPVNIAPDTLHALSPKVKNGLYKNTEVVLHELNYDFGTPSSSSQWIKAVINGEKINLQSNNAGKGLVPSAMGMGARDAVYLLENAGLNVILQGAGKVVEQSLAAGGRIERGATIRIRLN